MRELTAEELVQVAGGGKSCCCKPPKHKGKHKHKGNNGFGNGGHDGVPGNSNHQDKTR